MNAAAPTRLGGVLRLTWWLLAGLSLWLRSGFPTYAIGDAGLDDALFVRLARSLGAGEWLGPFNNTTLVKGMFYPLFMLASFLAGVPLKLAEQAVYLAAAAAASLLLLRAGQRWAASAMFAALALNPVFWTVELSRVMREGLYVSLSLAVIVLLAGVVFQPGRGPAGMGRGLLLGLLAGAFWTTREEGVWLLPAAATLGALRVIGSMGPGRGRALRSAALGLLFASFGFALVIGGNRLGNLRAYGLAERLEVNSSSFEHAYGALSRIAHRHWQRYVILPKDARLLAYQVSPAARELQPSLDGPVGERWRSRSCGAAGAEACPETLASWFQWALRDAVAEAGHYVSLPEAARFYDRLAREIDAACDGGDIPCLPARATLAPPFRWHYLQDALARAGSLAPVLLGLGGNDVGSLPSIGPEEQIDAFEDTAGLVLRRPVPVRELRGWVKVPSGHAAVGIQAVPGTTMRSDVEMEAMPDGSDGFLVSTTCPPGACTLVLTAGATQLAAIPFDSLSASSRMEQPGYTLVVHTAAQHLFRRAQNSRAAAIRALARPVGQLYAITTPLAALLGTAALLLVPVLRRWDLLRTPLFALVAASLVACLSRIALVAYLDVTAIPTVGILYLSAATPFVIVLAVGGILLLGALRRPAPLLIGTAR